MRARTALGLATVVAGALLLAVACASSQPASDGMPRALRSALPLAASVALPASAELESAEGAPIDLAEFAPLLATPELAEAASALERDDAAAAAHALEVAMAERQPKDSRAWQLLLGRLREQAADLKGAEASYELAASESWALSRYANLAAGRVALRAGQAERALEHLGRVPDEPPVAEEASLLTAEAAIKLGRHQIAIDRFRGYLASGDRRPNWTTISLLLGDVLLDATPRGADATGVPAPAAVEALALARAISLEPRAGRSELTRAAALEQRALARLSPADAARHAALGVDDRRRRIEALVATRSHSDALREADALLADLERAKERWGGVGCETMLLRSKALAGEKQWGKAVDHFGDVLRLCTDPDLRARTLYLAGKYAAIDKRHASAVKFYEQLEKEANGHRLADDARLNAALSYLELGAEARFTDLLSRMPDDYPEGDMLLDGVFRLALRRIERGDWRGTAGLLSRVAAVDPAVDRVRGHDVAGRERYFFARSLLATGERARALDEFARIIADLPLSYYMLHAYARLQQAEPDRARAALAAALETADSHDFTIRHRAEFETPGFRRALMLLRQGETEWAKRELAQLELTHRGVDPEILWTIATLYHRAGATKLSHGVARGLLTDWLGRWPAGDWRKAWELAYPRPYHDVVARESKKNALAEPLVYAIMREESAFDASVISHADAIGLMQLIRPTARHFGKKVGLPFDDRSLKRPSVNIALGCSVLASFTRYFPNNPLLGVPGYNAGPGRPRRWLRERPDQDFDVWVELIPFNETRAYTKRVLSSRATYAFLYERGAESPELLFPTKLL